MVFIDYLHEIEALKNEISVKEEKIAGLRAIAEGIKPVRYDGMPGGAKDGSFMEEALVKAADLENEVKEKKTVLARKKMFLLDVFEKMDDRILSSILSFRYINGFSVKQIANRMHYTTRWIYKALQSAYIQAEEEMRKFDEFP